MYVISLIGSFSMNVQMWSFRCCHFHEGLVLPHCCWKWALQQESPPVLRDPSYPIYSISLYCCWLQEMSNSLDLYTEIFTVWFPFSVIFGVSQGEISYGTPLHLQYKRNRVPLFSSCHTLHTKSVLQLLPVKPLLLCLLHPAVASPVVISAVHDLKCLSTSLCVWLLMFLCCIGVSCCFVVWWRLLVDWCSLKYDILMLISRLAWFMFSGMFHVRCS